MVVQHTQGALRVLKLVDVKVLHEKQKFISYEMVGLISSFSSTLFFLEGKLGAISQELFSK